MNTTLVYAFNVLLIDLRTQSSLHPNSAFNVSEWARLSKQKVSEQLTALGAGGFGPPACLATII